MLSLRWFVTLQWLLMSWFGFLFRNSGTEDLCSEEGAFGLLNHLLVH